MIIVASVITQWIDSNCILLDNTTNNDKKKTDLKTEVGQSHWVSCKNIFISHPDSHTFLCDLLQPDGFHLFTS